MTSTARIAILLSAAAVNGVGSWAALIAMWGFSSYELHSSSMSIAGLAISWTTPALALGPAAGICIDRFGPRIVTIASFALGAAASLGMALSARFVELVFWAVILGISRTFAAPAVDAMPPRLVKLNDLLRANAAVAAASNASIIVGPLIAGGILTHWSAKSVFYFDAITYLVGIMLITLLPVGSAPPENEGNEEKWNAGVGEGFRTLKRRLDIRWIFILQGSLYFSWAVYLVLEPIYVRDVLQRPAATFAYLQAAFGVGFVAAALVLSGRGTKRISPRMLPFLFIGAGLASAGYLGTPILVIAFISVCVWGIADVVCTTPARTFLQTSLPMQMHGRIFALDRSLNALTNLVALPLAGITSEFFGVRTVAVVTSAVVVIVGTLSFPRLRLLRSFVCEPTSAHTLPPLKKAQNQQ